MREKKKFALEGTRTQLDATDNQKPFTNLWVIVRPKYYYMPYDAMLSHH